MFKKTYEIMKARLTADEIEGVFRVLYVFYYSCPLLIFFSTSILWVGDLSFEKSGGSSKVIVKDTQALKVTGELLGCKPRTLEEVCTIYHKYIVNVSNHPSRS